MGSRSLDRQLTCLHPCSEDLGFQKARDLFQLVSILLRYTNPEYLDGFLHCRRTTSGSLQFEIDKIAERYSGGHLWNRNTVSIGALYIGITDSHRRTIVFDIIRLVAMLEFNDSRQDITGKSVLCGQNGC